MFKQMAWLVLVLGAVTAAGLGCGRRDRTGAPKSTIRVEGSDTMVNLAQAWAEKYHKKNPMVSVQVQGGGSGIGIASLIQGNCDMANTSRKMKPSELKAARTRRKIEPKEIIVGHDALAIFVHKQNPLDSISVEQLAEIYGEGGKITKWSDLGVRLPAGKDEIIRVSRQNSSGTYVYFREVVLGTSRDYKSGAQSANGSKEVIAVISTTPGAIGYSGMGYATSDVKELKVSKRTGEPGIPATVENAKKSIYPITRPLQIYVLGEPAGIVKDYLDWILSPAGQRIVLDLGYVSL